MLLSPEELFLSWLEFFMSVKSVLPPQKFLFPTNILLYLKLLLLSGLFPLLKIFIKLEPLLACLFFVFQQFLSALMYLLLSIFPHEVSSSPG